VTDDGERNAEEEHRKMKRSSRSGTMFLMSLTDGGAKHGRSKLSGRTAFLDLFPSNINGKSLQHDQNIPGKRRIQQDQ
jgi:hypothetical protein